LILSINPATIPSGVAQRTIIDAIAGLHFANLVSPKLKKELADWLGKLQKVDPHMAEDITTLRNTLAA
jgi:hypothetical protein